MSGHYLILNQNSDEVTSSMMNLVKSFPPGFCNEMRPGLGIYHIFKQNQAYHIVRMLAIKRCIRSDRFFKEERTITTRSPEKPITNGFGFIQCADVVLKDFELTVNLFLLIQL
jgi:hypothetical protein